MTCKDCLYIGVMVFLVAVGERERGNRGSRRWRIRVIENGVENGSENDREWE